MTSPRADHRKVVGDGQICLVTRCTVKAISQHLSIMIKRRFASLLLLNLLFNGCNNQPPAPNKAAATPTPVSSPTAGGLATSKAALSTFSSPHRCVVAYFYESVMDKMSFHITTRLT